MRDVSKALGKGIVDLLYYLVVIFQYSIFGVQIVLSYDPFVLHSVILCESFFNKLEYVTKSALSTSSSSSACRYLTYSRLPCFVIDWPPLANYKSELLYVG